MKRKLFLVRHATAETSAPMFKDYERELTGEGYIESARMSSYLKAKGVSVQRLVASSAYRTKQTAQVFAEQLGFDWNAVELFDNLYDCGGKAYLSTVCETPDSVESLILVGHNPDISYFAEYLTRRTIGSMHKASVCLIEFENMSWQEVSNGNGELISCTDLGDILQK